MSLVIVIPVHGDQSDSFPALIESIESQDFNQPVEVYIAEDKITDGFRKSLSSLPPNYNFIRNESGERLFALRNICRILDSLRGNPVVGIIDGDDRLFRSDCFQLVWEAYSASISVVWTANQWDLNGANHSGPLDDAVSVYEHPWVASHFRTFRLSLYNQVPPENFLNEGGNFFEKCYDQALMLPIIHQAHLQGLKTKYIDKMCYLYRGRINFDSDGRSQQLEYEKYIRDRGYVE